MQAQFSAQDASVPSVSATEHIYRVTCPILPIISVSENGAGWKDSKDASLTNKFGRAECLTKLRDAITSTKGQQLSDNADDVNIIKIDMVVEKMDLAEFYIHTKEPMSATEIEAARDDLIGQLSDGWGEDFECYPFDMFSTDFRQDLDIELSFGMDYDKVSEWIPYDAKTMRPASEIEHFVEQTSALKTDHSKRVRA